MADIVQRFFIKAPRERVFEAVSSPPGLDTWWTKHSAGHPDPGSQYQLDFGPSAQWRARVSQSVSGSEFELQSLEVPADRSQSSSTVRAIHGRTEPPPTVSMSVLMKSLRSFASSLASLTGIENSVASSTPA